MSGKYFVDCLKCKGKGWYYIPNAFDEGDVVPDGCEVCDGSGKRQVSEEHYEQIANAGALK